VTPPQTAPAPSPACGGGHKAPYGPAGFVDRGKTPMRSIGFMVGGCPKRKKFAVRDRCPTHARALPERASAPPAKAGRLRSSRENSGGVVNVPVCETSRHEIPRKPKTHHSPRAPPIFVFISRARMGRHRPGRRQARDSRCNRACTRSQKDAFHWRSCRAAFPPSISGRQVTPASRVVMGAPTGFGPASNKYFAIPLPAVYRGKIWAPVALCPAG